VSAVDLHCHLLPGVDDGPSTLEESLLYARAVVAAGTGTIVATPHVEQVDVRELPDRVHEVRSALAVEGIDLRVEVGGELKPESVGELDDEELEIIAHGPPGARWVLYEVPFKGVDDAFVEGAEELRRRGFAVLLAHPERSRQILAEGLVRLDAELAGAPMAANVGPLLGVEGQERHTAAMRLLEQRRPAVIATDAHPPRRPYVQEEARGLAARGTDAAYAGALVTTNPARLLAEGIRPR
jgi:protein-tyrosine phosphatase